MSKRKNLLSKQERLVLINQYDILIKLYPDNTEKYEAFKTIIQNEYECLYSVIFEEIKNDSELFDNYNETCNIEYNKLCAILNMYNHINGIKNNTKDLEIKKLIEENINLNFSGFDGTDHSIMLSLFGILNDLGLYKEFDSDENKFPSDYEEILSRYSIIRSKKENDRSLTYNDLIFIAGS